MRVKSKQKTVTRFKLITNLFRDNRGGITLIKIHLPNCRGRDENQTWKQSNHQDRLDFQERLWSLGIRRIARRRTSVQSNEPGSLNFHIRPLNHSIIIIIVYKFHHNSVTTGENVGIFDNRASGGMMNRVTQLLLSLLLPLSIVCFEFNMNLVERERSRGGG